MRLPYSFVRQSRDLARQSEMTQQITAIGRDLDVQNCVRGKKIGNPRADFCIRRENQKSTGIFAQAEFFRATEHSFRFDAAQFAFLNLQTVRQHHTRQREWNFIADFVIRRAADNLAVYAAAIVHLANGEAMGIWMLSKSVNLGDNDLVDVRATPLGPLDLDPGEREQLGERIDTRRQIDKFAQPINGEFHFRSSVMSSEVETSLNSSSERFFDSARNDQKWLMRTVSKIADRFAQKAGCLEYRTKSWQAGPCPSRMHNRSTFPDRRRHRRALCSLPQKHRGAPFPNRRPRSIVRRFSMPWIAHRFRNLVR